MSQLSRLFNGCSRRANSLQWMACRFGSSAASNSTTIADNQVIGPGNNDPTRMPTVFEQSSGAERIEYLAELAGRNAFLMDPLKVDHSGG